MAETPRKSIHSMRLYPGVYSRLTGIATVTGLDMNDVIETLLGAYEVQTGALLTESQLDALKRFDKAQKEMREIFVNAIQ